MSKKIDSIDENTKWIIVATIIAALIGGLAGSLVTGYYTGQSNKELFKTQVTNDQKNIALGLDNEISQIQIDAQRIADTYQNAIKNNTTLPGPFLPTPYYDQSGLYYLYGKDIFKFDPELSQLLYQYYFNVLRIEQDRVFINNNYFGKSISPSDPTYHDFQIASNDLFTRIVTLSDLGPKIIQRLKKYE
ncbi:MAG: hypothetical protein ACYDDV_09460 [Methanoregula sp.]